MFCVLKCISQTRLRGYVTDGLRRAPHWQCGGQRFDPAMLHQMQSRRTQTVKIYFFRWYIRLGMSEAGKRMKNGCCADEKHGNRFLFCYHINSYALQRSEAPKYWTFQPTENPKNQGLVEISYSHSITLLLHSHSSRFLQRETVFHAAYLSLIFQLYNMFAHSVRT